MRPLIASESPAPSTIVVESLSITILRARPSCESFVFSSLRPISSVITSPPVRIAMSSSMRLRRSPKPGALTATAVKTPRSLLTTTVARASPSTSSATISSGLPAWMTCSSTGRRSLTAPTFWFAIRTYGSSSTASMRSASVIMYGDR